MSEVDPKSIKEIIAKANDVDLAAALARVSGRWQTSEDKRNKQKEQRKRKQKETKKI